MSKIIKNAQGTDGKTYYFELHSNNTMTQLQDVTFNGINVTDVRIVEFESGMTVKELYTAYLKLLNP